MKRVGIILLGLSCLVAQSTFADAAKFYSGPVNSVAVAVGQDTAPTSQEVFTDLPGASVRVKIGGPKNGLVVATFVGESLCNSVVTDNGSYCLVRIVARKVDGLTDVVLRPDDCCMNAFDSTNSGGEGSEAWEGHAIARSRSLQPGEYEVRVQFAVNNHAETTTFRLDDWHLSVTESTRKSGP